MPPFTHIDRPSPFAPTSGETLPVWAVSRADIERGHFDKTALAWAQAAGFTASEGSVLLAPTRHGKLAGALFGLGDEAECHPFIGGKLARSLPKGDWHIETSPISGATMALAFGLGAYRFEPYRKPAADGPRLVIPADADAKKIRRTVAAVGLARDLVNTPANDMGPDALEAAFRRLAKHYSADVTVVAGDDLVTKGFPMIHAVGRAADQAPRLLELRWGQPGARKVTLVGKGVCFDTGGLDIKPAASMLNMKKDMGGAANVMALAMMIMDAGLPVDLRVLIPAVENSISAAAFRPGDVLMSRKGLTVQIDNTDAEGRLVLADALTFACEETPSLLIDMATLTGAARVALGPDLPPFYTDDEVLAGEIATASAATVDPLWRLPLFKPYEADVKAKIADLTNAPAGGFAGSITAALFLKRFVAPDVSWAHFDIFAWSPKDKPHAPTGGEAQGIRALFEVIGQHHSA
ncbi:leucyl aminopeptidase family protein [Hoeflea sp. YIM 152468]|uniref:leucyl aminopeptidase family protein n=1 Tax=Hoeflea sp. YIM 152468 TaxID=3031759 RepID=UPI0023DC9126|nr:leucyl aminopeptidase family protein [Hoeflea sp. YIM 152468]MDF1610353.1 leucyl aminopeptidase family protein [Hoeflea sp. YIM 152468]